MAETGRILRFDEIRGYGFIVPDRGNEDIFVHANELCDDKDLFRAGAEVRYEVTEGDRGLKAFAVHIAPPRPAPPATPASPLPAPVAVISTAPQAAPVAPQTTPVALQAKQSDDEVLADVLTRMELEHEFTELMLIKAPDLTGAQILRLREAVTTLALDHGWAEETAEPGERTARMSDPLTS